MQTLDAHGVCEVVQLCGVVQHLLGFLTHHGCSFITVVGTCSNTIQGTLSVPDLHADICG